MGDGCQIQKRAAATRPLGCLDYRDDITHQSLLEPLHFTPDRTPHEEMWVEGQIAHIHSNLAKFLGFDDENLNIYD